MKLVIEQLKPDHNTSELYWIVSEINKFLQTESPQKATFNLFDQFGMELHRKPNHIQAIMRYGPEDQMQDKVLPEHN